MYLIRFHSQNIIKMLFPKVEFLKFKANSDIHYPLERGEINCVDINKDHNSGLRPDFQKNNLINNYNIDSKQNVVVF